MPGLAKEIDELTPEEYVPDTERRTHPRDVLDPYETEVRDERMVIVSPFTRLNEFLKYQIEEIFEEPKVDIISHVQTQVPPYFDVTRYEEDKQRPFWIIDFFLLQGTQPTPKYLWEALKNPLARHIKEFENLEEGLRQKMGEVLVSPLHYEYKLSLLMRIAKETGKMEPESEPPLLEGIKEEWKKVFLSNPGKTSLPFRGYYDWKGRSRATYIGANQNFRGLLSQIYPLDEDGNLNPEALDFRGIQKRLGYDVNCIAGKSRGKPEFFGVDEPFCQWR